MGEYFIYFSSMFMVYLIFFDGLFLVAVLSLKILMGGSMFS